MPPNHSRMRNVQPKAKLGPQHPSTPPPLHLIRKAQAGAISKDYVERQRQSHRKAQAKGLTQTVPPTFTESYLQDYIKSYVAFQRVADEEDGEEEVQSQPDMPEDKEEDEDEEQQEMRGTNVDPDDVVNEDEEEEEEEEKPGSRWEDFFFRGNREGVWALHQEEDEDIEEMSDIGRRRKLGDKEEDEDKEGMKTRKTSKTTTRERELKKQSDEIWAKFWRTSGLKDTGSSGSQDRRIKLHPRSRP